jgi:hypothetical protein
MPMSKEEREELMEKVMGQPFPPVQELIDKYIKPSPIMDEWLDKEIPEEHRTEGPYDVIGPPLIPDEEAIAAEEVTVELDQESKDAIKERVRERGSENLQARVAAAMAVLDRKGEG